MTTSRGTLVIIGGAEDKLGSKTILNRFVQLAGGATARIVVISTASALGDSITEVYRKIFTQLGAGQVDGMRPLSRAEAGQEQLAELVEHATGIFLTGGNQMKLVGVIGGTRLGTAILEGHERGIVVGGTSAGASALSSHMVAFGASGDVPKHRMGHLSAGLGLLPGVIIDQHFGRRNRVGRLLGLVAQSPSQLGIGIDEDTAALVGPDDVLEVLGRGTVLIVDGSHLASNVFEAKRTDHLMVSNAVLHVLPSGHHFDLATRKLLPAPGPPPRPVPAERWEDELEIDTRLARRIAAEGADDRAVERSRRRRRRRMERSELDE